MTRIEAKNAVTVSQERLAEIFFCPDCPMRKQNCKLINVDVNEFEPDDLNQKISFEITHLCEVYKFPLISG